MFRLLLDYGASLDGCNGKTALSMCHALDMISMGEILENLGLEAAIPLATPWKAMFNYYPGVYTIDEPTEPDLGAE